MDELLIWIKDWLPSVAIIIGGPWVFFKWAHNYFVEGMPSIGGELSTTKIIHDEDFSLLEIKGLWKNSSPRPIKIDVQECKIEIFCLKNLQSGAIELDKLKVYLQYAPFKSLREMKLEPKLDSFFTSYCVLPKGNSYLIRWTLVQKKSDGYEWSKETVVAIG